LFDSNQDGNQRHHVENELGHMDDGDGNAFVVLPMDEDEKQDHGQYAQYQDKDSEE
jgi:hypothetical protein